MPDKQIKKCPRCGSSFECTSESDCWCERIQVAPKVVKYAMMHYTDCLCRKCLESLDADIEKKT